MAGHPLHPGRRWWGRRWSVLLRGAALLIPMILLTAIAPAGAVFSTTTVNPGDSFSADTLQPPTGLGLSSSCPGATVTATWTATSSTYATGYTLVRKSGGTVQNTINVSGRATVTQDDTGVADGTYTYELKSVYSNWLSSVASASTTVSCSIPTITNPGFESGLTGWTCSGGTGESAVGSPVRSGSQAAGVVNNGGSAKCQQLVTGLTPSTTYSVHIWIQGAVSGMVFHSTDGSSVSANAGTSAGAWGQINHSFTTGAGVTQMYVGFGMIFNSGAVTFDDMTLTQP
jgi:hypothetical protein